MSSSLAIRIIDGDGHIIEDHAGIQDLLFVSLRKLRKGRIVWFNTRFREHDGEKTLDFFCQLLNPCR